MASVALCVAGLTCGAEDRPLPEEKVSERIEIDVDANQYTYGEFCSIMREIYIRQPECKIVAKAGKQAVDISHNGMWDVWPVVVDTENAPQTPDEPLCDIIERQDATLVIYRVGSEGMPDAQMRSALLHEIKTKKKGKLVYLFSASDDTPLSVLMAHILDVTRGVLYDGILFGKEAR